MNRAVEGKSVRITTLRQLQQHFIFPQSKGYLNFHSIFSIACASNTFGV